MVDGTKKSTKIIMYSLLIIYAIVTLYPFAWSLMASFHTRADIVGGNVLSFDNLTFDNYKIIAGNGTFPRWILNSFFVAIVGTFLNVIFNSMAGYAISRINFKGASAFLWLVLVVLVIPGQVLLIPNYIIMKTFGLLDSYSALILPAAVNATYIFMMSQFFKNFSKDVEEAAYIDGLSRTMIFFKITMPMAKPYVATQALFIFQGFWNEFQKPLLYMQSENMYTLPVGLQSFQTQFASQWNLIMAGSIVSILPMIILYIVLNKYFMEGNNVGGEK